MPAIYQAPGNCECEAPGCKICTTVTDACTGAPIAGATVTVTGPDGGTCTTDAAGNCCVDVADSGDYTVSASKAGYKGGSKDITVDCPESHGVGLTLDTTTPDHTAKFLVKGCNGLALPGAKVTINGGAYTTGSDGKASFSLPIGSFPYTVSRDRFTSVSGTATRTDCGTPPSVTINMTPASGYACCLSDVATPIKTDLQLTGGGSTLSPSSVSGCRWWYCGTESAGPTSASFAPFGGQCQVSGFPQTYECPPTDLGTMSLPVAYQLDIASTTSVSVVQYVPFRSVHNNLAMWKCCGSLPETCTARATRCGPATCRAWYWTGNNSCPQLLWMASGGAYGTSPPGLYYYHSYPTASFTVTSVEPFAAVVTLTTGTGFDTGTDPITGNCSPTPTGNPTTTTVAISEAP